ncbi:MAG: YdcH family protein [Alphaproteobacteria bacterium]|nr:YdcH family protein [Alphaproteobacteria bacterium]
MMEHQVADQRLVSLRIEHRDLDDVISKLVGDHEADDVRMRRMKKRKLALKDEIAKLESDQLPNLIA